MGSLLMHASFPSTHVSSFLWDFCIFPFSFFTSLFTLLSFISFYLFFFFLFAIVPPFTAHAYGFLYYLL